MDRIHNLVVELTNNKIDNLVHVIKIINIVFDNRHFVNYRDVIRDEIWKYECSNKIDLIKNEHIDLLIRLLKVFYPNLSCKQYSYCGKFGIKEVKPTLAVNEKGYFILSLTSTPNITFELLDYTVSDNFFKVDFKNEFIVYISEVNLNRNDIDYHLKYFRRTIELVLSNQHVKINKALDIPTTCIENIVNSKFKNSVVFNGWVGDLSAIVSYT